MGVFTVGNNIIPNVVVIPVTFQTIVIIVVVTKSNKIDNSTNVVTVEIHTCAQTGKFLHMFLDYFCILQSYACSRLLTLIMYDITY